MLKILALTIVFSVGLSAPTFAQTSPNPPADIADEVIDETLILEASTPEDRAALLRRCAGPPPKPLIATNQPKQTPVSEPIAVVERIELAANRRGG